MYTGETRQFCFRINEKTARLIDGVAAAKQMTRTELLTNYITEGLAREKTSASRTKQDDQPANS